MVSINEKIWTNALLIIHRINHFSHKICHLANIQNIINKLESDNEYDNF